MDETRGGVHQGLRTREDPKIEERVFLWCSDIDENEEAAEQGGAAREQGGAARAKLLSKVALPVYTITAVAAMSAVTPALPLISRIHLPSTPPARPARLSLSLSLSPLSLSLSLSLSIIWAKLDLIVNEAASTIVLEGTW